MRTTTKRKLLAGLFTFTMSLTFLAPVYVAAEDPYGLVDAKNIKVGQSDDLKGTISQVVNIILGFLGIIAVVIILFAGFKWMTAGGNEEQVGEARKTLLQAVIGLAVVFLAWAIASFVITNLGTATSAPAS
jgi:type IV secretory pathway VirB2 component (pilin)